MKPRFQAGWRQVLEEKSGLRAPGSCSRSALNPELLPGPFIPFVHSRSHVACPLGHSCFPPTLLACPSGDRAAKTQRRPPTPPLQWQSRSVSRDKGSDRALGATAQSRVCKEEAQGMGRGAPCKPTGPRWCPLPRAPHRAPWA